MTRIPIPPELIDHILHFVALDDNKERRESALKACASTSYAFWKASRPRLFSEVTLTDNVGKSTPENIRAHAKLMRFLALLQDDIARASQWLDYVPLHAYITKLIIQPSKDHDILEEEIGRFVFIVSGLPLVLSELRPSIRTFIVSNRHHEISDWKIPDMVAQRALEQFIVSQPIVDMQIYGIKGFPLKILPHCHSLRSISMDGSKPSWKSLSMPTHPRTDTMSVTAAAAPKPPRILETLSFTKCPSTLTKLLVYNNKYDGELFDKFSVRKLETSFDELRPSGVKAILLLPSLSHLAIHGIHAHGESLILLTSRRPHYRELDFGLFSSLRVLEINYESMDEADHPGLSALMTWKTFHPKTISMTPSSIETLILNCNWTYCRWIWAQDYQLIPASGWNDIDRTLSNTTRFPRLRAIQLNLTFHYDLIYGVTEDCIPAIRRYFSHLASVHLRMLFPLLSERGSRFQIKFKITVLPSPQIELPPDATSTSDGDVV